MVGVHGREEGGGALDGRGEEIGDGVGRVVVEGRGRVDGGVEGWAALQRGVEGVRLRDVWDHDVAEVAGGVGRSVCGEVGVAFGGCPDGGDYGVAGRWVSR